MRQSRWTKTPASDDGPNSPPLPADGPKSPCGLVKSARRRKGLDGSARRPGAVADGLAAAGEERLAGGGPVDGGGLLRQEARGHRANCVGPGGEDADGDRRSPAVVLAHIEVAVAVEFDDAGKARGEVGREL